ncbi:hypothetical protein ONE63_001589 [Megalurothrips usitatus]|uniref:AAA+ ATPase domain-containing protein n=1 Tax=Megalurothrips usitatus TaxID=439358 RepID=A0AAV7XCK2_9NEOP|nr:hypothetical protein ONE63_001589 [Megalurothrips usitatus]
MLRIGHTCRTAAVVRQVLRTDFQFCLGRKELHQLTNRIYRGVSASSNGNVVPSRRNRPNQKLWREYEAFHSMVQRSGLLTVNSPLLKLLSTPSHGIHTSSASRSKREDGAQNQHDSNKDDNEKDDKNKQRDRLQFLFKVMTYSLFLTLLLLLPRSDMELQQRQVSWQEFVHQMLSKGEVQQIIVMPDIGIANIILHDNAVINGKPVRNRLYTMQIPDVSRFEEKLRETEQQLGIGNINKVPVVFERQKDSIWPSLAITLFVGFLLLNLVAASKTMKGLQMPWSTFTKAKFTLVDPKLKGDGRGVRFVDIAGMKEAKTEVMEFVDYLKKPEVYRRLGAKVPKGSLLLGPPGCGKTLLAKAVATEANVPFLSMNGSEFIEVVGGLGASRVRDLFKEARQRAPCIVYIDEIDAIGSKRSANDFGSSEKIQTLLQLLIELDGMANNQGVIMLASTNRAEVLDEALLRPGRFDRHILIAQPTLEERREIFEVYLNKLKLDNPSTHYSGRLAQLTPSYSGADIANICNEAALHAAGLEQKEITAADLEYAVSRVKFGREKKERTICPDDRKQIAYYQAGRTIAGWMLKNTDALMKVSIIQYTSGVGHMQHFRPASFLTFKEELYDRMIMYLGGKAAELLIFHENSTQAEADLKKVTQVAYNMVTVFGMNDAVGEVSFPAPEDGQRRFYSRKLQGIIDFEARKLIAECFIAAEKLVKEHSDKLEKVASNLLEKETLSYEDICNLIGPPPHGHKSLVDIIEFGEPMALNGNGEAEPKSERSPSGAPSDNSPEK